MKGDEFFTKVLARELPSAMDPGVAGFFRDYLSNEKVIRFGDRYVVNTHFPPYPGAPFNNMVEQFNHIGEDGEGGLFSVTLAVTNRCGYNCWHCYNSGRDQNDLPLDTLQGLVEGLQDMGAVHVTLSGGEPLLRDDLENIVGLFDDRTYLTLNTTGAGLTAARAHALRERGLFGMGISLDSTNPVEHDRMRGKRGAFSTAIKAMRLASESSLYPYIIAVANREMLEPERFHNFMRFAAQAGALEVHLLEPCATGRLNGNTDALLGREEKDRIMKYQKEYACRDDTPVLSSFSYIESAHAFGCGAGLTHLYIDGTGEVSPCNLVPLSFGNIRELSLGDILGNMRRHFRRPRATCAGRVLSPHIKGDRMPLGPEESERLCEAHLPRKHKVPLFFEIRNRARGDVGGSELRDAYDTVHGDYDDFWLSQARWAIHDLVERVDPGRCRKVFDAGAGTGYATALLAARLGKDASITAADLSPGMLSVARSRTEKEGYGNIRFVEGDALEVMDSEHELDLVFSSWVLGYVPMGQFFSAAHRALAPRGQVAFVVHREDSPRVPLRIFRELVAEDPSALTKRVSFGFPRDMEQVNAELSATGFETVWIWQGEVVFRYSTADQVLEHLLKSGSGTAYFDAIDKVKRDELMVRFIDKLEQENVGNGHYEVPHEYIACVARKV